MNPNDAQQTVVTSFLIVLASVYVGAIASGARPTARPIVGVAVGGAALLAAASSTRFAPLASKFSALVATTALLTSGFYAAAALGRYYSSAGESVPYTPPTS